MISAYMVQLARWSELDQAGIRYCFVITHEGDLDERGRWVLAPVSEDYYGPADAPADLVAIARKQGQAWRTVDDDGNVTAKGRMWASDAEDDWTKSDAAFAPLWDYAAPDQGAVALQYRKDGKWVSL